MNANNPPAKPRGILRLLLSVLGAAIGVQSRKVYEQDFTHGNPVVFIIAGIVFTAVLIGGLILLVRLVLSGAGT